MNFFTSKQNFLADFEYKSSRDIRTIKYKVFKQTTNCHIIM